ncbi:hypothetical protein ACLI4Z_04195 [Natrialbaceae archaeon A-arb3/5]
MTERALSTGLSYVLLLGVTVILISGLSVAAGDLLQTQHEQTVESELNVVGERIAADLMTVDRLVQTSAEAETVSVVSNPPQTVSDGQYSVRIESENSNTKLVLESAETSVIVTTIAPTSTDVEETRLSGGTMTISYQDGSLVVSNG